MNQSQPLPLPLLGDKSKLSVQARKKIADLNGARPFAFLSHALSAWALIITAILTAIHVDNIWINGLAVIFIATRMNILGLLVHEQVHRLGFRTKQGDWIANLLVAYPLIGISVEGYAKVHLSHHRYFFTDQDPDFLRKAGKDWTFPMPYSRLIKLFLSDLTGLSFIKLLRGKRMADAEVFQRPNPTPKWIRPIYYLTIASLLTYFGLWQVFLVFWLLPLLTVFPIIVRLGAISEHIYNLEDSTVVESSPLILQKWWEKALLPNLNFTLHIYHHYHPGIAHCNLPKVHQIYKREGLVDEQNVFYGYWAYLKYLQTHQSNEMKDEAFGSAHYEKTVAR